MPALSMKNFIQLTRHPYEEPYHLNLVMIAGNEHTQGTLEFYLNPDNLKDMGRALIDFPSHAKARYLFTRGSEYHEDRFGWFLRLYFKALINLEKCAIQIRMNNNQLPLNSVSPFEPPQLVDFYLLTNSKRIHDLGRLFEEFGELQHYRLYWDDDVGYLDNATQNYQGTKANPAIYPLNVAAQTLNFSKRDLAITRHPTFLPLTPPDTSPK